MASVSIQDTAWIPRSPSYHLNEQVNLGGMNMVANLINNDKLSWNDVLIKSTFSNRLAW